jgi:putative holliday junction resolvase
MGRIIAIDYGRKRVGLAVTDEMKIFATSLETVHSKDVIAWLAGYLAQNVVERFVVGEPKTMDNKPSESTRYVEPFIRNLKKAFPDIPVDRMDERFTSKMASAAILEAGLKKKDRQDKALVDRVSAVIILQSYMEQLHR